jgi:hypothetical protein
MSSSDLSDDDVGGDTLSLTSISSHISDVMVMPSPGADSGLGDDDIGKTDSASTPKGAPSLLLTPQQWMDKQDAIEECLRGGGAIGTETAATDSIDLWHLRELCIAPGGLLDPSLRKRAWPLLTQALLLKQSTNPSQVEVSSTSTSSSTVEPVTPSANDILLLQRDVRYTVWNVLESFHIQQQKGLKKQSRSAAMTASSMSNMPRRVTFATVQTLPISPINAGEEVPSEGTCNSKENENQSPTSVAAVEAIDTSDVGTTAPSFTFEDGVVLDTATLSLEEERSISSSSRSTHRSAAAASRSGAGSGGGHAYRKASPPEQKILTNVVTSCLRVAPPESDAFEDDRFRYYTGLHDLTALMMVNMESPSLTSLVL